MRTKFFMRFPGGRAKAFTLSYDDGVEQDARLIAILNEHGIRATFNINSASIRQIIKRKCPCILCSFKQTTVISF